MVLRNQDPKARRTQCHWGATAPRRAQRTALEYMYLNLSRAPFQSHEFTPLSAIPAQHRSLLLSFWMNSSACRHSARAAAATSTRGGGRLTTPHGRKPLLTDPALSLLRLRHAAGATTGLFFRPRHARPRSAPPGSLRAGLGLSQFPGSGLRLRLPAFWVFPSV